MTYDKYRGRFNVSIHAPAKGATLAAQYGIGNYTGFNPRSREGSDNMTPFPPIPDTPFQSTLPRRERHVCSCNGYYVEDVSIHAPAKGATVNSWIICNVGCHVSIHAPAKGATIMRGKHRFIDLFQSTLPRRERRVNALAYAFNMDVSIHAPAKGAT